MGIGKNINDFVKNPKQYIKTHGPDDWLKQQLDNPNSKLSKIETQTKEIPWQDTLSAMTSAINQFAQTNAKAAAQANAMQLKMFNAQMAFNAAEAEKSRQFSQEQFKQSMDYNAQQAQLANSFTQQMWNQSANYNIANAREAREWSAQQADIQRQWQEHMDNTQVQRRMADLKNAGINPILAGGLQASTPSGAMGTTTSPSMSGASGQSASASGTGGASASAGLPSAYMENTSNELALFGAAINAIGVGIDKLGKAGATKAGLNLVKQFLR